MSAPNVTTDALRSLHCIHRQLADLKDRLQRGPKRIDACQASVSLREEQRAAARAAAKTARMVADAKQVQLKGGEQKIEELKRKLNAAASNREYQALKDQIAAQEMTNSVLTDEILEELEKLDSLQAKTAEADQTLASAREKTEEVQREVNEKEPGLRAEVARLEADLKESETALPPEIQGMYQRVVRQRGEDALAAVENEFCTGCHQHVPLNVCAQIMLAQPMFCKTCGRLLYMPEEGRPRSDARAAQE